MVDTQLVGAARHLTLCAPGMEGLNEVLQAYRYVEARLLEARLLHPRRPTQLSPTDKEQCARVRNANLVPALLLRAQQNIKSRLNMFLVTLEELEVREGVDANRAIE